MNITCESCSAKYTISDDKVRGKVIKIRCKKCSNVIVVKAGEAPAESPAEDAVQKETHVFDYGAGDAAGADGGWHLVVDGQQVGPMSVSDIAKKLKAGEIDADTYVWREEQEDWKPLSEVEAFAKAIAAAAKHAAEAKPAAVAAAAAETPEDDIGDLFVQKSGVHSAPKPAEPAAAPAAAAPEDDDDDAPAAGKLRGERNENSVLFSLGNLSALADGPATKPASSSTSTPSATGSASLGGGEGSGLIDIRSMASAYLGGAAPSAPKKEAASGFGDLPMFSTPVVQDQLVIIPPTRQPENNNTIKLLIAAVAGLAIILLVVVVFVVMKKDPPASSGGAPVASGTGSGTEKASGNDPEEDPPVDAAPEGSGSDEASASGTGKATGTASGTGKATGTGSASGTSKGTSKGTGSGTSKGTSKGTGTGTSKGTGSGTGTAKPPKTEECPDKVGCLIADNPPKCCEKYSTKGTGSGTSKASGSGSGSSKTTDDGDLPETLDNKLIKAGIDKVKSKVKACRDKAPLATGTLKLKVKVGKDGSVTDVSVASSLDSALDSCAVGVVKGAKFQATQKPSSFTYPFPF